MDFFAMPPPPFIDYEAKDGSVSSEDEDLVEFNKNEVEFNKNEDGTHDVAKIAEDEAPTPSLYVVVVPPPTQLLSTKVKAMLLNAATNNMFITSSTKFDLEKESYDAGTSKRFPMFFWTEADPTKRGTFPVLLEATTMLGKK